MTPRERMAELLVQELQTGEEAWYGITVVHAPTNTFLHGVLVPGKGPTDAWHRFHGLNLCPQDCETGTHGPFADKAMAKVPPDLRLRALDRATWIKLGQ